MYRGIIVVSVLRIHDDELSAQPLRCSPCKEKGELNTHVQTIPPQTGEGADETLSGSFGDDPVGGTTLVPGLLDVIDALGDCRLAHRDGQSRLVFGIPREA